MQIYLVILFSETNTKSKKLCNLKGAGRPLLNKDFDEELYQWIRDKRAQKQRVSRRIIQEQAIKMTAKCDTDESENEFKVHFYFYLIFKNLKACDILRKLIC